MVVFHYHHFYLADAFARPMLPDVSAFPHAAILGPVYRHGHFAVELFWAISGFVFAHVYLARPVTARAFLVARIARLYPLHLATLLLVAGVQAASLQWAGHWQIYAHNDLRHFLLNLGMATHWSSWSRGLSFNGPIWSVSLETVAYALFFLSLGLLRGAGPWAAAGLGALFFAIGTAGIELPLFRPGAFLCAAFFFAGTAAYFLHVLCEGRRILSLAALAGMAGLGGLGLAAGWTQVALIGACSVAVLLTAGLDRWSPPVLPVLRTLGDLSYSIYLVHVPMQMILLLVLDLSFGASRALAASPLTLPVYVLAVLGVSWLVHVRFERPAGRYLRQRLARPRPRRAGAHPNRGADS